MNVSERGSGGKREFGEHAVGPELYVDRELETGMNGGCATTPRGGWTDSTS